ncbi:MAG: hypothetical protein LKK12_01040 [Bacteroidales bacterium]|nr:hypothetical protein [Bacteroidales bacterium]
MTFKIKKKPLLDEIYDDHYLASIEHPEGRWQNTELGDSLIYELQAEHPTRRHSGN